MKTLSINEILSRTSLFQNISVSSMQALADICLPKNIRKKEQLFFEGDKAFFLYVLVTGGVKLYKTAPDGRDVVIKSVKPGEMFAEAILFESDRYPVSASAVTTSLVYQIPKHQFNCLLGDEDFRNDFLRNIMLKLRFLADQIQHLTLHDVEDRLRLFLNQQFGRSGEISVTMSKKDMASAIGATPETFSRLLLKLKQENKFEWIGNFLKVEDSFFKGPLQG